MIIQNTEALQRWLISCLGRMCEADPVALSKYVLALLKKDKPEMELQQICLDCLEVFLLKDTKIFVKLLFDCLNTKSYLNPEVSDLHENSIEGKKDLQKTANLPNSTSADSFSTMKKSRPQLSYINNIPMNEKKAKRCKDYDEKGYCILGDSCYYDHGSDPMVVDDICSILNFAHGAYTTQPYNPENPGMASHGFYPIKPTENMGIPIPLHHSSSEETFVPNIELPQHIEPTRPRELIHLNTRRAYTTQPYNPENPGMASHGFYPIKPTENMGIPIPLHHSSPEETFVPNIELPQQTEPTRPRELIHLNTRKAESKPPEAESNSKKCTEISNKQKGFDYSRLGTKKIKMSDSFPLSSQKITPQNQVSKVPNHLNTVSNVKVHISKPKIKNLQEAINKQFKLYKKKQELLESQLNYQKLILERLKAAKSKKEKDALKQIIAALGFKIIELQADVKTKSLQELKRLACNADGTNAEAFGVAGTSSREASLKANRKQENTLLPKNKECRVSISLFDNRLKTILVSDFHDNKEALVEHFRKFGELGEIQACKDGYLVTFNTRKEAEMALINGNKLGEEILRLSWFEEDQQLELDWLNDSTARDRSVQDDSHHFIDADDDDDDEEDKDRSWRW